MPENIYANNIRKLIQSENFTVLLQGPKKKFKEIIEKTINKRN